MEKTRRKMKKMWKTLALAAFLCSSALQGKTFGRAILQKGWPSARHVSSFFCLLVAESVSNTVLFVCFSSWLFPSTRLVVVSNSPRRKERERDDGQAAAGTHPRVLGAGKRRFGFRVASAELPRGFREFRGQNGFKITSQSTSGYRDDLPSCAKPPWRLTAQHLFHTNRINIYSCTACEPWCICICICVSLCICVYMNMYMYMYTYISKLYIYIYLIYVNTVITQIVFRGPSAIGRSASASANPSARFRGRGFHFRGPNLV